MTLEETLAALDSVRAGIHDQFPTDDPPGVTARLDQLDSHLSTVAMVVEHIYDEAGRHAHDPRAHRKARGEYVQEA